MFPVDSSPFEIYRNLHSRRNEPFSPITFGNWHFWRATKGEGRRWPNTKTIGHGGGSDHKNLPLWCCKDLLYGIIDRNIPLNQKLCSKIDRNIVSEDDLIGRSTPISKRRVTLKISICLPEEGYFLVL